MPAIGHVTKQNDGSFKGSLKTLAITASLNIIPNAGKTADTQPDYRVFSNSVEIGAAWIRMNQDDKEYVSLSLSDPSFGKLFANLGRAAGQDDPDVFALIWNPKD